MSKVKMFNLKETTLTMINIFVEDKHNTSIEKVDDMIIAVYYDEMSPKKDDSKTLNISISPETIKGLSGHLNTDEIINAILPVIKHEVEQYVSKIWMRLNLAGTMNPEPTEVLITSAGVATRPKPQSYIYKDKI